MYQFQIDDMTCGHCAGKITRAIRDLDASADVRVDVGARLCTVESAAGRDEVEQAIFDAGYTPAQA